MPSLRSSPLLLAVLAVVLFPALAGCGKSKSKVTLSPELQAVQCPPGRPESAAGAFADARVTFLCIPKELADKPHLLRCDLESRPMICEDEGAFVYTRTEAGKVLSGIPREGADLVRSSRLTVNFRKGPPRQATFEEEETDWKFLTGDGKRYLPAGFTQVKGTLCDRNASVLDSGICNLEARSSSLYWHIAVEIRRPRGDRIEASEYREALEFWLGFLGKLVVDPAPK
jgi:hypothetical protein